MTITKNEIYNACTALHTGDLQFILNCLTKEANEVKTEIAEAQTDLIYEDEVFQPMYYASIERLKKKLERIEGIVTKVSNMYGLIYLAEEEAEGE